MTEIYEAMKKVDVIVFASPETKRGESFLHTEPMPVKEMPALEDAYKMGKAV